MRLQQHNTTRLYSAAGTFGVVQIVAGSEHVILDVQSRNYNSEGHLQCDHALANLSLDAAMQLRDLLTDAIDHSRSIALDVRQTAVWSPATYAHTGAV